VHTAVGNIASKIVLSSGSTPKVALGDTADSITLAGTEVGTIVTNAGFKSYATPTNYIRVTSSAVDLKSSAFSLVAGTTLLLSSESTGSLLLGGVTYPTAKIGLMGDGSGKVANGNMEWSPLGNLTIKGSISIKEGENDSSVFYAGNLNKNLIYHPNLGDYNTDYPPMVAANYDGGTYTTSAENTVAVDGSVKLTKFITRGATGTGDVRLMAGSSEGFT